MVGPNRSPGHVFRPALPDGAPAELRKALDELTAVGRRLGEARAELKALGSGEREALRADAADYAAAAVAAVRGGTPEPQVTRQHEAEWREKLADAERRVGGLAEAHARIEDAIGALVEANRGTWTAALGLPAADAAVTEAKAALAEAEAERDRLLLFERWLADPWTPPRLPQPMIIKTR